MPRAGIQAVTFDVGGTLIKPWPSVGEVYARVAARHGFPGSSIDTLNRQFARAWAQKADFFHAREDWRKVVRETFHGVIPGPLASEFFDDLYAEFATPNAWHIFPDVRPTLEELKNRGVPLAVISNWDERLRPLLDRLGLSSYFDPIVVSVEVGQAKPGKAMFERAIAALKLPTENILHVGDSALEDVAGAKAAGMMASLLDRASQKARREYMSSLLQIFEFWEL